MKKEKVKELLKKQQKGIANADELNELESFANELIKRNNQPVFQSDIEKHEIKRDLRKRIQIKGVLFRNHWLKYAASGIILIGLSLSFWFLQQPRTSLELLSLSTKPGERKEIKLSDGTVVELNSKSILSYPKVFNGSERNVTLEGEAIFHVTKDATRPFMVESRGVKTTVLGTVFNINAYPDDETIQVSLLEGSVRVDKEEINLVLEPMEQSTVYLKTSEVIKSDFDSTSVMAWRKGSIVLNRTTFEEISKISERTFGVKIKVEDVEILQYTVSGKFENPDLKTFLATICATKSLQFKQAGSNEILIYKN